ncbi:glucosyltransferase domain-containing protein [Commensalibacter oyaizuii]|uniref:Glucosyl transferase GtrII family protein n=1 Tax=Commensalibacter oyaizuii TaxID=3043873 RepID=A0ABT6PYV1_9PROT|nr:glucosyltransferase domain-containing protein [Commensalibacter sp. TBRC 16381]MDI2089898.1 hypothetical protein [Commensalibacter sp. TBRC 16381]
MHEEKKTPNNYTLYLLYALIIFFFYSPLILQTFAVTDDYSLVEIGINKAGSLLSWDIANGRPLYGILQNLIQDHMNTIERLSWLRGFSIVVTVMFCIFIHRFLLYKIQISSQIFKDFLPVFLAFIPPIVVYNAWASCSFFMIAVLCSGCAYYYLFDDNRVTSVARFFGATTILLCSFLIYQPAGMAFIYFIFLGNCLDERKIKFKNILLSIISLFIAMFISLLALKILPKLLYGYVNSRGAFNDDIIAKINWFLSKAMVSAVNNYNIIPNLAYTIISTIVLVAGLFFITKQNNGLIKLTLTIVLMIAVMFPSLVAKESWAAFRLLIGLDLIVITIILYTVIKACEFYSFDKHSKLILFSLLGGVLIYMQHCMVQGFIREQQGEYQALTQELTTIVPKDFNGRIRFDLSNPYWNAFTKMHQYDEFGVVSMQKEWAVKGMMASVKKAKGLSFQTDGDMILKPGEVCQNDCILIHPGSLLKKASMYK